MKYINLNMHINDDNIDDLINSTIENKKAIIIVPLRYVSYTRSKIGEEVIIRSYIDLQRQNESLVTKKQIVEEAISYGVNHLYIPSNENFIISEQLFNQEITLYENLKSDSFDFSMLVISSWAENIKESYRILCTRNNVHYVEYESETKKRVLDHIFNYLLIVFLIICTIILFKQL